MEHGSQRLLKLLAKVHTNLVLACVTSTHLRTLSHVLITTPIWSVAKHNYNVTMLVNPAVATWHIQVAHWCIKETSHSLL